MAFKRLPVVTKLFKEHSPKIAFRALSKIFPAPSAPTVGIVDETPGTVVQQLRCAVFDGDTLYIGAKIDPSPGASRNRVFKSTDQGASFTPCAAFPLTEPTNTIQEKMSGIILADNGDLVTYTENQNGKLVIHTSDDGGTSWTKRFEDDNISDYNGEVQKIYKAPNGYIYATGRLNSGANPVRVWRSTNNGVSWTSQVVTTSSTGTDTIFVDSNGYIHTGVYANGFFRSTNEGSSWSERDTNGSVKFAIAENTNTGTLHMSGAGGRSYRSTDSGSSWVITQVESHTNYLLFVDSNFTIWRNNIAQTGLIYSTNDGLDYSDGAALPDETMFYGMLEDSNYLYGLGGNGKLYMSHNMGANWYTSE